MNIFMQNINSFSQHIYFLCGLLLIFCASSTNAQTSRKVTITIDDLPFVGQSESIETAAETTDKMLAAITKYKIPAAAFVTGKRVLVEGQVNQRLDLLRRWRDSGVSLENHGLSHISFQQTPLREYLDDALQGMLFPEMIMKEKGGAVKFYRHPFNHTGATMESRLAFENFLKERNIRLAPFTVEHADYVFNRLYEEAKQHQKEPEMKRIGEAYLAHLDTAFDFAERLSLETFGRDIPQIFLIHASEINADYLDRMLARLQKRGYKFTSLEEAMTDSAYETPDVYVGGTGISWFHRWRVGLKMEKRLRDEPDPPKWVIDEYQKLSSD